MRNPTGEPSALGVASNGGTELSSRRRPGAEDGLREADRRGPSRWGESGGSPGASISGRNATPT